MITKVLTAIAASLFLAGCETTTGPTANIYDKAATIAQSPTIKPPPQMTPGSTLAQIIQQSWRFRNNLDHSDKPTDLGKLEDLSPQELASKHRQHLSYLN